MAGTAPCGNLMGRAPMSRSARKSRAPAFAIRSLLRKLRRGYCVWKCTYAAPREHE